MWTCCYTSRGNVSTLPIFRKFSDDLAGWRILCTLHFSLSVVALRVSASHEYSLSIVALGSGVTHAYSRSIVGPCVMHTLIFWMASLAHDLTHSHKLWRTALARRLMHFHEFPMSRLARELTSALNFAMTSLAPGIITSHRKYLHCWRRLRGQKANDINGLAWFSVVSCDNVVTEIMRENPLNLIKNSEPFWLRAQRVS